MVNGEGGPPRPGQKPPMKKSTRNWMLIGGLAAAGLVIWYVMRNKSQQSQTGAATTDPSIDPSTGLPWAAEMGGMGGYGGGGGTPSLYGYYDPSTGQYITGTGSGGVVTAPTTNASWAQQTEQYLMTLGYDPMTTAAALGKYLTGQPLTPDQMSIVQAALAFFGQPPQGAPPPVPVPKPKPPPPKPWPQSTIHITLHHSGTLAEIAKLRGWDSKFLAEVEKLNHLSLNSRLRKGQRLIVPAGSIHP